MTVDDTAISRTPQRHDGGGGRRAADGGLRRRCPRTRAPQVAVLAGDYLLARASVAMARLQNVEVVQIMATALDSLVAGEIMQIKSAPDEQLEMGHYLRKVGRLLCVCVCVCVDAAHARSTAVARRSTGVGVGMSRARRAPLPRGVTPRPLATGVG